MSVAIISFLTRRMVGRHAVLGDGEDKRLMHGLTQQNPAPGWRACWLRLRQLRQGLEEATCASGW